jgi:hypothetical protein
MRWNVNSPLRAHAYERSYLNQLAARYRMSLNGNPPSPVVEQILARPETDWNWEDVYTLELAVIAVEQIEQVRRARWWWLGRYKTIAPATMYQAYLDSKPPDADSAPEKDVRADVEQLANAVHYSYTIAPIKQRLLNSVSRWIMALVLILFLVFVLPTGSVLQPALLVLYAGYVGGFVSVYQRLQSAEDSDLLLKSLQGWSGTMTLLLVPLRGGIFAILLYLFFIGNFVTSIVFPQMHLPDASCTDQNLVGRLLDCTYPMNVTEFAKLLVWAFLAGFAERVVPDSLQQLIGRSGIGKSTVDG